MPADLKLVIVAYKCLHRLAPFYLQINDDEMLTPVSVCCMHVSLVSDLTWHFQLPTFRIWTVCLSTSHWCPHFQSLEHLALVTIVPIGEKCPHSDSSHLGDITTQCTSIVKVIFQVNLGQPVPSRISSYVCSRKEHLRINGKDCFYSSDVLLVSQPTVSKHWMSHRVLTQTNIMASSFLCPPLYCRWKDRLLLLHPDVYRVARNFHLDLPKRTRCFPWRLEHETTTVGRRWFPQT